MHIIKNTSHRRAFHYISAHHVGREVAAAERGYLGKQLHAAMLAKHPDQEILTGALAKAALVRARKYGAAKVVLISHFISER